MQARQACPAESSSSSYGLVVHLLLLSTPPLGDAVAFSYRPESVCLERTCTSLTSRALRRTARRFNAGIRVVSQSCRVATIEFAPASGVATRREDFVRLSRP